MLAVPLTLAAIELATNSLTHGGGYGKIRFWQDNGSFVCEVQDAGQIEGRPLLGRERPSVQLSRTGEGCGWPTNSVIWSRSAAHGWGLWYACT